MGSKTSERYEMTKGFKDSKGKFHPTDFKPYIKKKSNEQEGMKVGKSIKMKARIKAIEIGTRELRDHPLFEGTTEWLDVFAETPEVIVADDKRGLFHIWFGGESHYVHQYTPDGHEIDVFSFGFDKNRLSKEEVLKMIERTLNEDDDE